MGRNKAAVIAMYRKFPFLADFVAMDEIDEAELMEASYELLELAATEKYFTDYGGVPDRYFERQILLLDEKGEKIGGCRCYWEERTQPVVWYNPFSWFAASCFDETIKHTLDRVGGELVFQIFVLEHNYRAGCSKIILFRAPKTLNILSWLEELPERHLESIESHLEEINARGNYPKMLTDGSGVLAKNEGAQNV